MILRASSPLCFLKPRSFSPLLLCMLVLLMGQPTSAESQDVQAEDSLEIATTHELPSDLTAVGLEQLLNFDLVVTTPSKKGQKISDSAAAVYVISQEDIRRSGATHVAELFRMIPGVNVARVSSNRWAISIRGFNQMFANKLLVLIDGVSVFSPTTNGVYWEANELVLEDIDRIEVVRGPGGALWGANAVNGVINIVTKHARDTQSSLLSGGAGSHERTALTARHGGSIDDDTFYRVYASYHDRGDNRLATGTESTAEDSWQSRTIGFRVDGAPNEKNSWNLAGDYQYQTDKLFPTVPSFSAPFADAESYAGDSSWRGLRLSSSWTHVANAHSEIDTHVSFSRKERVSDLVSFSYDVANLEAQHRWRPWDGHDFLYGGAYRYFYNDSEGSPANIVEPNSRGFNLWSAFAQDEITLIPKVLRLTLGSKVEYNELTALDFMPSARILYTLSPDVALWGAVSRAVASPALFFEDSIIPVQTIPDVGGGLPGVVALQGSRSLKSESLLATELGMRANVSDRISMDVALFYNDYNDLISVSPNPAAASVNSRYGQPALEIPLSFGNSLGAYSVGGEVAVEARLASWWKVAATHTYLSLHVDLGNSGATGDKALYEVGAPRNRSTIKSQMQLADAVEFDVMIERVGSLGYGSVDGYTDASIRLGYEVNPSLDLALVGQNLFDEARQEFQPNLFGLPAVEIERSFYVRATYSF